MYSLKVTLALAAALCFCASGAFGQAASAIWALSDPGSGGTGQTVAASGNVTATSEELDSLEINNYAGPSGSQRVRILGNSWPANEFGASPGRYLQFTISPASGNNLNIDSIALNLGAAGGTDMYCDLVFSTSSTFSSPTLLLDSVNLATLTPIAHFSLVGTVVNDGQTLYLRIYPWYQNTSVSTGKYVCPQNLTITGHTGPASAILPLVTTASITGITTTTAAGGGNVTADGGATVTGRGVCWNTSGSPTIANSRTLDGSGTGSFVSSLTALSPATPYYVRAYATNSSGTGYGNEVSFATVTPSAGFLLSATSIDFDSLVLGQFKTDSVHAKNNGTDVLNISSVVSDFAAFTVIPGSAVVAVGDSAKFVIMFSPTSVSVANGRIVFTHNAAGSPDTVTVTGRGLPLPPTRRLSNGAGGGSWMSGTTWAGGFVPSVSDTAVIATGDSVWLDTSVDCAGLTIKSSAKLSITGSVTCSHDFTIEANGKYYPNSVSLTSWPAAPLHTIDNASYYIQTASASSTIGQAGNSTFGNLFVLKAGTTAGTDLVINGDLTINNGAGQTFRGARDTSRTHVVHGNVNVITGQWSCVDVVSGNSNNAICVWTVDGNVIVGSPTTAAQQARMGPFTSALNTGGRTGVFNVNGNLTFVNGARFQAGSSSTVGSSASERGIFNLKGNLSLDSTTTFATNSSGVLSVNFVGTGTQTVALGTKFLMNSSSQLLTVNDTIVSGATVVFTGGKSWASTSASAPNGDGAFVVHGTLRFGAIDTLKGLQAFTLSPDATLGTANVDGISSSGTTGSIQSTGTRAFAAGSNYQYSGLALQTTGNGLPTSINNLTINSAAGVTLSVPITVVGTVSLLAGHLNLNGNNVMLGPSGLLNESAGSTLSGTSGTISTTRMLNAPNSSNDIAGLGVGIGSSADLGNTVITRGHAVQAGAGSRSIGRYFDITPTTNTGLNATLVFRYDDSELNSVPEANLLLFKSTDAGATWSSAGGTVNTTDNTLTLTGVNELSRWTAGVSGSTTVTATFLLRAGWDMVSLPVRDPVGGSTVPARFPTSTYPFVYEYTTSYQPRTSLENMKGYWAKFSDPAAHTESAEGTRDIANSLGIGTGGWKMVGSLTDVISTNDVSSDPPGLLTGATWFKYTGFYNPTTTLEPGHGYWVKVAATTNGILYFTNPSPVRPAKQEAQAVEPSEVLNSLTITDNCGVSQTLYFGADAKKEISVERYAMPPLPPVGGFDARFATSEGGSMVQTHAVEVKDIVEFPVTIQSEAYPLTISWKIDKGTALYEVTDGLEGRVFRAKDMRGEESMQLTNSDLTRFTIRLVGDGQLPKEFALEQNYPNPFNPTTSIKYALPVDSRVMVEIYNLLGQRVRTLINDDKPAGYHSAVWEGTGNGGQQMASGAYFLHLSAKGLNGKSFTEVRKLMMVK